MRRDQSVLLFSPLLLPAMGLVAGIILGDSGIASRLPLSPLAMLVLLLLAALLSRRWPLVQSVAIVCCFAAVGMTLMCRAQSRSHYTFDDEYHLIEAVVESEPVEKPRTYAADILLPQHHRRMKCYISKDARSSHIHVGDGLRMLCRVSPNSEWRNGTFDYSRYLTIHGFSGRVYVAADDWQPCDTISMSFLERLKLRFLSYRQHLLTVYRRQLSDADAYGIVAAMALGDKSAVNDRLRQTYAVTGASHVLALSGLHLGIVYGLLSLMLMGYGRRRLGMLVTLAAVWAFVLLTGMSVSVLRAATMVTVYGLMTLLRRESSSVNSLALAAMLLLLVNPYTLFDVGFQLSFASVLAILVIVPLFERLLPDGYMLTHRLQGWLLGLLFVSVAAQVGTAPLVAYYFGRLPLYFLVTNLVAIPGATVILYLSLLTVMVPQAGWLLTHAASLLNRALTAISQWPHASIEGLQPSAVQVALTYVVVACLLQCANIVTRR